MNEIIIASAVSLCVMSLSAISSADTLIMRDGTRVQGTVVSLALRTITFRPAGGVSRRYPISQVEGLEFPLAENATSRAVTSGSFLMPAGTALVLRTVDAIDSRNAGANQTFSAIGEQAVPNASGGNGPQLPAG